VSFPRRLDPDAMLLEDLIEQPVQENLHFFLHKDQGLTDLKLHFVGV
jgi:hypothetical protein